MALLSQFSAITGRPRRRRMGPIISARAAYLPAVRRQEIQDEATQEELGIAREGLALDYARLEDEQKEAKKAGLIGAGQLATSAGMAGLRLKESLRLPKLFGEGTTATTTATGAFPASTTAMASPWETSPVLLGKTGTGAGLKLGAGLTKMAPYALPVAGGLLALKGIADTFGRKKRRAETFRELRRQYGEQFEGMSPDEAQAVIDEWLEGRGPLEEGKGAAMEAFQSRYPDIYAPALGQKQAEWKTAGRITGPARGRGREAQIASPYSDAMKRIMSQGR